MRLTGMSPYVSKTLRVVVLAVATGLSMPAVLWGDPAPADETRSPIVAAPDNDPSDLVNTPLPGNDGDIADCQCDTGNEMMGFTKLCTLRAAIQTHNQCGTGIGFAGPFQGENAIKPAQETPVIIGPISIDGLGQTVEISAEDCFACTRGLEIDGTATITDLVVYGFGIQILNTNGAGSMVSGSVLGTTPDLPAPGGIPADPGIQFTDCVGCTASDNIVAGIILFDGAATHSGQVSDNYVGVGPGGEDLGFGSIDIVSGSGNHIVRRNYVASGGFHIRLFGPDTGNSLIEDNHVGLSPTGVALGGQDGIELRSDFNTVRGNVVSGNGGHGISVVAGANDNLIEDNLIGTSADGTSPLGNGLVGVNLSGTDGFNMVRDNVISANGAEGIYSNFSGNFNKFLFNLVGTDASGTLAMGNQLSGIRFTTGFVVVQGNVVADNNSFGIRAEGSTGGHTIIDNYVGTDITGTLALGNFDSGIRVTAPDVLVSGNLIPLNGGNPTGAHGIVVQSASATGVEVSDNRVGMASDGTPLGNTGRGIYVTITAHDNVIGPGNVVAYNDLGGLAVGNGTGNQLTANSVFDNDGLGIDLGIDGPTPNDPGDGDGGANNLQNTPVLSGVIGGPQVSGVLDSQANRSYRIEIFSNPYCDPSGFGEGKTLVGQAEVTTNGSGHADFAVPFTPSGANPTATATDLTTLDTSEFSPCLVYQPPVTGPINSVGDAIDQTPDDAICFTGNMIMRGGMPEPECTLRAAIQTGHEAGAARVLVFDIPPEQYPSDPLPIIRPMTLLPAITEALIIDGSTQPDTGTVAVSGSASAPLPSIESQADGPSCGAILGLLYQLQGSGAEIRDQTLYCAETAIAVTGADNDVFHNLIADNSTAVLVSGMPATGNDVVSNTMVRNGVGIEISEQAGDTIISRNLIGTEGDGADLGNGYGVYVINSGGNFIDDNTVVASDFVGITLEDEGDGTQTSANKIRGNRIGTDNLGRAGLGNDGAGIRILNARGNMIGGAALLEGNVISANGIFDFEMEEGGGILIDGYNSRENLIQGNYIGTTVDGLSGMGNARYGIYFNAADANTVGGTEVGAGNVISGNVRNGIHIFSNGIADGTAPDVPQGQLIQGNFIGTDRDGLREVANGENGIFIEDSSGNLIGGPDFASGGNLISGNVQHGVQLSQSPLGNFFANRITGNRIGTDVNDQPGAGLPNFQDGVALMGFDTLLKRNRIAHNGITGVAVADMGGGHQITRNSISSNDGLGIDLVGGIEDGFGVTANDPGDPDEGANRLNNFPVITDVQVTPSMAGPIATIRGSYDNQAGTYGPIEVFNSPDCDPSGYGEGETYLARHSRRSGGRFKATADATGLAFLTATSSVRELGRPFAHTSEFSQCFEAPPPPGAYLVINEVDSVPSGGEFIELTSGGQGGLTLTGTVLVFYDGADDLSYAAIDLDGQFTDADGFFVAGNAGVPEVAVMFADGLLLDGPAAVALYEADDADFPDGTPVTTDNLIDAVVYGPAGAPDAGLLVLLQPDQPQVDEAAAGDAAADALQRCPDSAGGTRYTDTYQASLPTPGEPNACVVCYIEPEQTSVGEGQDVSLTATVLVNAITPMAGIDVDFEVVSGPNSGEMASLVTDAFGEAGFSYTGLGGTGEDTVSASGIFGGVPFFCQAGVSWQVVPILKSGFE